MKNRYKFLIIFLMAFSLFSCQKDFEVGDAGSVILSGDWVVSEYDLDNNYLYGPYTLQIYNTSFDTESIWVDNIYDSGYKVKCLKGSETTFNVTGGVDFAEEFTGTIDILEARVIDQDSIIFRVVLYNAAGTVVDDYYEAGHRYTGWLDDQH